MSIDDTSIPTILTSVYIDGYNLYHGLLDTYGRKYSWLDLDAFARSLFTDPNQRMGAVKYFTSEAPGGSQSGSWQRQQAYWRALEMYPSVERIKGKYRQKATRCSACRTQEVECRVCGAKLLFRNEKMTDVNIASHMVRDACEKTFDMAILVGGDTDLKTAVTMVRELRRVMIAFPPGRANNDMKQVVGNAWFILTEAQLKGNQLPDEVTVAPGVTVRRPDRWR